MRDKLNVSSHQGVWNFVGNWNLTSYYLISLLGQKWPLKLKKSIFIYNTVVSKLFLTASDAPF